jgi:enoyl-CoA hydratase/carnithine racemase
MPTIALINGHAFGAGFFLGLAHDYCIQNPSRGYLCLPEVDLGVVIPSTIAVMIKAKMPSIQVYRDAVIEGRRWGGPQALKAGIVDALGGLEETLKFIEDRQLLTKVLPGAVGGLKEDMWREVLNAFENHQENVDWRDNIDLQRGAFDSETESIVAEWEKISKL